VRSEILTAVKIWIVIFFGSLRREALENVTNVSEEHPASIFWVEVETEAACSSASPGIEDGGGKYLRNIENHSVNENCFMFVISVIAAVMNTKIHAYVFWLTSLKI
jgi:hypothetical protein